jgi:hypothetical protein
MTMMMAYGGPEWYQIQHTRDHGNARYGILFGNQSLERFSTPVSSIYTVHIFTCSCLQRIKNPNYKGKWKTPWIDNPGNQIKIMVLYVYVIKYLMIQCTFSHCPIFHSTAYFELYPTLSFKGQV